MNPLIGRIVRPFLNNLFLLSLKRRNTPLYIDVNASSESAGNSRWRVRISRFDGYVTMGIGLDSGFADLDKIARTALKFLKAVE